MAGDFIGSLGSSSPGTPTGSTADQLRNQVLSQLVLALNNAFPQASADVVGTASAGAATLPANPVGFLTITVSGTAYRIPLYGT